jgi:hypothetical protein
VQWPEQRRISRSRSIAIGRVRYLNIDLDGLKSTYSSVDAPAGVRKGIFGTWLLRFGAGRSSARICFVRRQRDRARNGAGQSGRRAMLADPTVTNVTTSCTERI